VGGGGGGGGGWGASYDPIPNTMSTFLSWGGDRLSDISKGIQWRVEQKGSSPKGGFFALPNPKRCLGRGVRKRGQELGGLLSVLCLKRVL